MSKASTTRHSTNAAMEAAIDAYSWADECDRREAERAKVQPDKPVITIAILLSISLCAYVVGLLLFPEMV